jgi:hypothetical protein
MTEPIDAAHDAFKKLSAEVSRYIHVLTTEADVRLKVIDRMFTEVLGWPYGDILAEAATPSGFADYTFRHEGRSRLIVEAKRDGRSLGCEMRTAERGYKLNGPTFKNPTAKEGINQAIRYCGEKNAELACVTNGREWIVFRGNRLGDGIDTREGVAFVYPNWAVLEESFAHFYNLLSAESCRNNTFRPVFRTAEGMPIRMSIFQRSVRPQGSARYVSASELGADIDKMMSAFFKRLPGDEDPDLLRYCFVETAESRHAEGQLARITDSLATRIKDLHTGTAEELTKLLQRTTETRRHEFVVLVGTKGAGKSTFINRFFEMVLPEKVAQGCTILDIDMAEYPGDIDSAVDWVDRALLLEAEQVIFKGDAPTLNELTGVFYDEYTRLKKGLGHDCTNQTTTRS